MHFIITMLLVAHNSEDERIEERKQVHERLDGHNREAGQITQRGYGF